MDNENKVKATQVVVEDLGYKFRQTDSGAYETDSLKSFLFNISRV